MIACNGSYTKCGTECIALTACCHDTDCTPPTNGTVSCNSSHVCIESCAAPYTMACNHACTDTTTDVNNCGSCGNVCGGQCALSRCIVTLASGQSSPGGITVDSSNAYWVTGATCPNLGAIMKVPLAGGTPTPVATSQSAITALLAVDSASAYWVASACASGPLQIRTAAKTGGGGVTAVANLSSNFNGYGFAIDTGSIYLAQQGYQSTAGTVVSVAKAGGTPANLATGVDANVSTLALDSTYVYWTDNGIYKTPIGGGSPTSVSAKGPPFGDPYLAIANGTLYWSSNTSPGTVSMVSTAGGTVTDLATGLNYPQHAVTDGSNVYFIVFTASFAINLMKVPVTGGSPTMVVSGAGASSLAVDANSVYWTSGSAIMKATPK